MESRLLSAIALLFIAYMFLPFSTAADTVTVSTPGIGGMVYNGDLQPGQLRYAMNIDPWSDPGVLKRRKGIGNYGATPTDMTGYMSLYDQNYKWKLLTAIHDTMFSYYDSGSVVVNLVGQFWVSDTFATTIDNGAGGLAFCYADGYHDWTVTDLGLIHCDGYSLPVLLTPTTGGKHDDSTQDTTGYGPRVLPLGLPAPGQLMAGNAGFDGSLSGTYQYAYAYLDTSGGYQTSALSIPSNPVTVKNGSAYLSGFDRYKYIDGGDDMGSLLIARKKIGSEDQWYVIDTLFPGDNPIVLRVHYRQPPYRWGDDGVKYPKASTNYKVVLSGADSVALATTADLSEWGTAETICGDSLYGLECLIDSLRRLWGLNSVFDTILAGRNGDWLTLQNDTGYSTGWDITGISGWAVYNVWDTAAGTYREIVYLDTGIAAGDVFIVDSVSDTIHTPGQLAVVGWETDTVPGYTNGLHAYADSTYGIAYSYYDPLTGLESPRGPAQYIAIADSVATDSCALRRLVTGVPSQSRPKWIRLWQTITQDNLTGGDDTLVWYSLYDLRTNDTSQEIVWGNWTDAHVVTGIYPDSIERTIYDYQLALDINGDPYMQPPYRYDNQLMFSDIAFAYDRFWGIVSTENRVYYSGINDPADWDPLHYISIGRDVDDWPVAIETKNGILYAFKRNSIWQIAGTDATWDMRAYPYNTTVGAVSRETVARHWGEVYFLTPKAEFWNLEGKLSAPVDNWLWDTMFTSSTVNVVNYGRLVPFDDNIKITNDSTGKILTYYVIPGSWTSETFASFQPMGSLLYDSTENMPSQWLMWDTADVPLKYEYLADTRHDGSGTTPWAAEFFLGNGNNSFIQGMELNARLKAKNNRNYFRYSIFNEDDSLATDSLYIQRGDSVRFVNWSLKPVQARKLYLRLFAPAYDSVSFLKGATPAVEPCYDEWSLDWLSVWLMQTGSPELEGTGDTVNEQAGGIP